MTRDTRRFETWRVMGLSLELDEPESVLRERALDVAGLEPQAAGALRIGRKSVDARRQRGKRRVRFVVHVDLDLDVEAITQAGVTFAKARESGRIVKRKPPQGFEVEGGHATSLGEAGEAGRVVVVGAGPAGLFAGLALARNGIRVDLIDRGPALAERGRAVARFANTREVDPEANLLFGAGGAGTYSDGKLYTRVDHPLEATILDELIACGAPPAIAYDARAHIGTDQLHRVLPALETRLEELGVRFHYGVRLEGLVRSQSQPDQIIALRTSQGEMPCDAVMLALGHSARDTFERLHEDGVVFASKPFQFGVRIEHPQGLIDRGRYGTAEVIEKLGPAYYGLAAKATADARSAHSFCMCPGGQIVASVNVPGYLCTNGMSNSRHSSPYANAGLVTTLGPQIFGPGIFDGIAFQAKMEAEFFAAGGSDYTAPAQRADDFLVGRESSDPGPSSYKFGLCPGRIDELLPEIVRDALRQALRRFDNQIPGFAGPEGLLVGVEARSSAPIRMPRDEATRRGEGFANLYPIGEGAGYAGGIMSAAIDGARSAQAVLGKAVA